MKSEKNLENEVNENEVNKHIYENYSMPAFVLCGKSPADKIVSNEELKEMPINNKVFLKLKEKPILDYVATALLNSKKIGDIYFITDKEEELVFRKELEKIICSSPWHYPRIINIIGYDDNNLIDNIEKTFRISNLKNDEYALIVSSDTPLINPKLVNDLLKEVFYSRGYDAYVPYTKISMMKTKYPKINKRSMFEILTEENNELKNDGVRTGNMFVLKKETFVEKRELFNYLFQTRKKSYLALAKDIGLKLIKNHELKTLFCETKKLIRNETRFEDISLIIKDAYNISAKEILVEPEFCIDVDKKNDYNEIKNYFL